MEQSITTACSSAGAASTRSLIRRRKRQPGDQVEAHALPRVRADPVGRRKPSKTCIVCLFTHAASPINPRLLAASDIFNLLIYINICRLARMLAIGPRCWAKVHFPT